MHQEVSEAVVSNSFGAVGHIYALRFSTGHTILHIMIKTDTFIYYLFRALRLEEIGILWQLQAC